MRTVFSIYVGNISEGGLTLDGEKTKEVRRETRRVARRERETCHETRERKLDERGARDVAPE